MNCTNGTFSIKCSSPQVIPSAENFDTYIKSFKALISSEHKLLSLTLECFKIFLTGNSDSIELGSSN